MQIDRIALASILLAACAVITLVACASPPPPDALAQCASGSREAIAPQRLADAAGSAARGGIIFRTQCAKCHSPRIVDRSSSLFYDHPRLDCASYLDGVSDGYLRKVIRDGGESVGLDSLMKPFSEEGLDDDAVDDVVRYLRSVLPSE